MNAYTSGVIAGLGLGMFVLAGALLLIGHYELEALQSACAGALFVAIGLVGAAFQAHRDEEHRQWLRRKEGPRV